MTQTAAGHQSRTRCLRGLWLFTTRIPRTGGRMWPRLLAGIKHPRKWRGTMISSLRISGKLSPARFLFLTTSPLEPPPQKLMRKKGNCNLYPYHACNYNSGYIIKWSLYLGNCTEPVWLKSSHLMSPISKLLLLYMQQVFNYRPSNSLVQMQSVLCFPNANDHIRDYFAGFWSILSCSGKLKVSAPFVGNSVDYYKSAEKWKCTICCPSEKKSAILYLFLSLSIYCNTWCRKRLLL